MNRPKEVVKTIKEVVNTNKEEVKTITADIKMQIEAVKNTFL